MSSTESVSRYLNVVYLASGLLMAWLFSKTSGMMFSWAGPRADRLISGAGDLRLSALVGVALAIGVTAYCWRSARVYKWVTEVIVELSKVTWPAKDETQRSTRVVIVFSIIVDLILASFDFLWKFATDLIL